MRSILIIPIFLLTLQSNQAFAQTRTSTAIDLTSAKNTVKVYPTLATTSITFEFQKNIDKQYSLQIYNFMGKKMSDMKLASQHNTISLIDFYRGIYIYQLRDKNGALFQSGKFQIVK